MTENANGQRKMSKQRRIIMMLLGGGLGVMLAGAATYFTDNPSLIAHMSSPATSAAPASSGTSGSGMPGSSAPGSSAPGASMPSSPAMSPEAQKALMGLMQQIKENPGNTEALVSLAEHFMHMKDWAKAENFALRATAAAPKEARPLYLLGIIQHNQDRNVEAAANLEKVAAINNDPSVRYSLGMIYAYYLNDIPRGLAEFQKGLDTPSISAELKTAITDEMAKAKIHATHIPEKKEN